MTKTIEEAIALFEAGCTACEQGHLRMARQLCREAAEAFEAIEGTTSPDLANILNEVAELSAQLEEYPAAESNARQALVILDGCSGELDPGTAATLIIRAAGILGAALRHLGRYAEAEPQLMRVHALAQKTLGEESDQANTAANNLAVLYKYTGEFDKAETLYRQALTAVEARHGTESLEAATLYHNLGGLEHARGRFAEGEGPARKAWEIRSRELGPDHPLTVADEAALAGVLDGLGRYDESEPIYHRALAVFERLHGPVHYEIAVNLNNLAGVRAARRDAQTAESLYRQSLQIKETLLGKLHPDTALGMHNLGALLLRQEQSKNEATALLLEALDIYRATLPPEHPRIVSCQKKLEAVGI